MQAAAENLTEYKQVEFQVSGGTVMALFPTNNSDSETLVAVQEMLISSYISHAEKVEEC